MTAPSAAPYVGRSVPRVEDRRLLLGRGRYVADIRLPGMVEAAVLRSPFAHARLAGIDTTAAEGLEGVVAVLTAADLEGKVEPFTRPFYLKVDPDVERRSGLMIAPYRAPVLAAEEVFRVGEPVAVVVATDRYVAEDALELIRVDYEPLPTLTDPEQALAPGAPQLHPEVPGNVAARFVVEAGDVDAAFAGAPHTLRERFRIRRAVGVPMETRGTVAVFDQRDGLQVWSTTQRPHLLRTYLSEMLHLPEQRVRVVAPDMGGSFGGGIYNEEILVGGIAMLVGLPVRWIEDRPENLANARHARDQIHDVEVAFDDEGRILGLKDRFLVDTGAYNPFTITLSYNTAAHLRSEFKIDDFRAEAINVLTNKRDNTPIRGAGRPEATWVIDRVMDMVADEVGKDPADVRMKNLIPTEAMPYDMGMLYRDGGTVVYDSGDYPSQLRAALELIDYEGWRRRQAEDRPQGRRLGIGISAHVEGSGYGPYEGALVRVDATGQVVVHSGSNPHGQGHATTLAQVCADALGVRIEDVTVRAGDTALIPYGGGTFASRSAVTAGSAVHMAAERVRGKVVAVAARLLEVDTADIEVIDGLVHPVGAPKRAITFAEVAAAAAPGPSSRMPQGMDPGLEAQAYFVPPTVTFSSGTHVAVVEVDDQTGHVAILAYAIVDDCGRALNPMIVDGQQHGGVAHGVGNALFEEAVYDDDGQLLTGTFMDYLLPTAMDVPHIHVAHQEHPSPLNPLGVKGCGEGGTVSVPAAVANAVADAMKPLHLRITECPLTPERLVRLIEEARTASS